MKKSIAVWTGLVVFASIMKVHAEIRIWTSVKGDTVEAEFVNIFAGNVKLKRADSGNVIEVPMSALCAADIKYLNESIPPEIDIEVDVDNDRKNLESYSSDYGTYDYSKKAQNIKCKVTVTKKSRPANMTPLKACIYVFSEDSRTDETAVLSRTEQEFSFKYQDSTVFSSETSSLTITKSSGYYGSSSNSGAEYKGYLAYVEDSEGKIVGIRSSSKVFEENIQKIKPAVKGTRFDRDMDMINPPSASGSNNNKKGKNRN
jgi:hypothetical protein